MLFKINSLISLFLGVAALSSCSPEIYKANWQYVPVVTDGQLNEWRLPLRYVDGNSGLQYNITNDKDNLYLSLKSTGRMLQRQILSSGLEIKLAPNGKEGYSSMIHFPVINRESKPIHQAAEGPEVPYGKKSGAGGNERSGSVHGETVPQMHFRNFHPQITLSGFNPGYDGTFEDGQSKSILAAAEMDSTGYFSCEFTIPLKSFMSVGAKNDKNSNVVGLEIACASHQADRQGTEGTARPEGRNRGGRMGGGMSARMGGGMGVGIGEGRGGGRGGRMGGESGDRSNSPYSQAQKDIKIKMKIGLAGIN